MSDRSWLRTLGIVVCIGSAACGRSVSPVVAPAPTPAPVRISAEARLLEMLDQRRMDTALVDALLADSSGTLRARTALAIGQNRIRLRYPALRALLVDGDTAIAANAAYALGIARDYESVSSLSRAVQGAPDAVAREAAWALGEMGEMGRTVILQSLGEGLATPVTQGPIAARAASDAARELKRRGQEEQYEAVVHEYSLLLTGQLEVQRRHYDEMSLKRR
jgi:hypothetical protein